MSRQTYATCFKALFISPIALLGFGLPSLGQPLMPPQRTALQYNPPNRGAPGYTRNAGSRTGPCGDLTAVQPTQTNWGETLERHPTFGIYLAESAVNLTFELREESSQEILHQVTFDQIEGPGISLYTLPDTAPILEPNQFYRWQVSLDCEQFNTPNVQYRGVKRAGGTIFRRLVSEQLQTTLSTAAETEKPSLLAANGLWYDTVHTLLLQRLHQPDTERWINDWQNLLIHPMVQLNNLMEAAPIECCLASSCVEPKSTSPSVSPSDPGTSTLL
ncbi:MAG: DUF928 domain-containing protein [Cyanobacteria bacterium P01_F01_bin.13]